jgi:hypothetical protein
MRLPRILFPILTLPVALAACALEPARVMIAFREPLDATAPALIARLENASGATIRYLAPVSPTLHAYSLACPKDTASCDAAIAALRRDPAVADVIVDRLRKAPAARP